MLEEMSLSEPNLPSWPSVCGRLYLLPDLLASISLSPLLLSNEELVKAYITILLYFTVDLPKSNQPSNSMGTSSSDGLVASAPQSQPRMNKDVLAKLQSSQYKSIVWVIELLKQSLHGSDSIDQESRDGKEAPCTGFSNGLRESNHIALSPTGITSGDGGHRYDHGDYNDTKDDASDESILCTTCEGASLWLPKESIDWPNACKDLLSTIGVKMETVNESIATASTYILFEEAERLAGQRGNQCQQTGALQRRDKGVKWALGIKRKRPSTPIETSLSPSSKRLKLFNCAEYVPSIDDTNYLNVASTTLPVRHDHSTLSTLLPSLATGIAGLPQRLTRVSPYGLFHSVAKWISLVLTRASPTSYGLTPAMVDLSLGSASLPLMTSCSKSTQPHLTQSISSRPPPSLHNYLHQLLPFFNCILALHPPLPLTSTPIWSLPDAPMTISTAVIRAINHCIPSVAFAPFPTLSRVAIQPNTLHPSLTHFTHTMESNTVAPTDMKTNNSVHSEATITPSPFLHNSSYIFSTPPFDDDDIPSEHMIADGLTRFVSQFCLLSSTYAEEVRFRPSSATSSTPAKTASTLFLDICDVGIIMIAHHAIRKCLSAISEYQSKKYGSSCDFFEGVSKDRAIVETEYMESNGGTTEENTSLLQHIVTRLYREASFRCDDIEASPKDQEELDIHDDGVIAMQQLSPMVLGLAKLVWEVYCMAFKRLHDVKLITTKLNEADITKLHPSPSVNSQVCELISRAWRTTLQQQLFAPINQFSGYIPDCNAGSRTGEEAIEDNNRFWEFVLLSEDTYADVLDIHSS